MNVPQLRFSGFEGEWEELSLKSVVSSLVSGVSVNSTDKPAQEEKYGVLKTSSISKGKFIPLENKEIIDEDLRRAKLNPTKDTILISRMNTPQLVGEVGYVEQDYLKLFIPDRLWMATTVQSISTKWLAYLLVSNKYNSQILNLATGTSNSMKNISKDSFLSLNVFVPSLKEQEKVSSFFTSLDKKIERQQEKIEKLEQFKKGMMQKIFSQELRFKDEDGGEFSKWEEKLIGDFLSESRIIGSKGDTANKLTVKLWGKGIIAKKEIAQGSVNTQYYTRKAGQLMYGKLDFLNCAFGIVPPEFEGYESTLDSPAFDIKNMDSRFLLEYITRKEFYLKYGSQANGSRRAKRIHPEVFFEMPIFVPSLEEQTKVGSFLDLLDNKVEKEKVKLMVLEERKRGFLRMMYI